MTIWPFLLALSLSLPLYICIYIHIYLFTFLLLNRLKAGRRHCAVSTCWHTRTYLPRRKVFYYSAAVFHYFTQHPKKVYAQGYISSVSFNPCSSHCLFVFQNIKLFLKTPRQLSCRTSHFLGFSDCLLTVGLGLNVLARTHDWHGYIMGLSLLPMMLNLISSLGWCPSDL